MLLAQLTFYYICFTTFQSIHPSIHLICANSFIEMQFIHHKIDLFSMYNLFLAHLQSAQPSPLSSFRTFPSSQRDSSHPSVAAPSFQPQPWATANLLSASVDLKGHKFSPTQRGFTGCSCTMTRGITEISKKLSQTRGT